MRHVVMFSSGIGSWAAGRRVADRRGTADLTLLFADTRIEDADNYRFLEDAARDVGGELVIVRDGRDIWQVFRDRRRLGTSQVANCSIELKQKPARAWIEAHCDPSDATLYVGIDWTEMHRLDGVRRGWAPYPVEAPLCEPPYKGKPEWLAEARARGLRPPRLYDLGFPHANCGGGCVRAGQSHFAHLLKALPDVYADWERNEEGMRAFLGRDVSILKDRAGGDAKPLTLAALRERIESAPQQIDLFEWGGCACFVAE